MEFTRPDAKQMLERPSVCIYMIHFGEVSRGWGTQRRRLLDVFNPSVHQTPS